MFAMGSRAVAARLRNRRPYKLTVLRCAIPRRERILSRLRSSRRYAIGGLPIVRPATGAGPSAHVLFPERRNHVPVHLQTQDYGADQSHLRTVPRYNPERDGRGGIRGGCSACFSLYNLQQARLTLDAQDRSQEQTSTPGVLV